MFKTLGYLAGILFGVLIFLPYNVSSIWCFQCNSQYSPECAAIAPNDTTSEFFKECRAPEWKTQNLSIASLPMPDASAMFCRKIYQKIFDRDGMVIVLRKCGWVLDPKQRDCYSFSQKGHTETVCQCFQDACNASTTVTVSATVLSLLLCLALYFYFLN